MGKTITEKIIAAHAGLDSVSPGQLVNVKVDLALANDITAPLAIQAFAAMGADKVFDRDRVVLTPDHFTPNKDIHAAEQCAFMRRFAHEQELTNYFEVGEVGIEHVLLPEQGLVLPGDLVIGADSHTCTYGALGAFATGMGSTDLAAAMALGETWLKVPPTMRFLFNGKLPAWIGGKDLILSVIGDIGVDGALYRAMEFAGPAIDQLSMDGRFTMANMAIEAGGKNGIFQVDEKTVDYIRGRSQRKPVVFASDDDADYLEVREYDVSNLEPQVAMPHLPSNVRPVSQVGVVELDQVVIGSCTNGREEDLRIAAELLMGRETRKGLRCIIFPGTRDRTPACAGAGLVGDFSASRCDGQPSYLRTLPGRAYGYPGGRGAGPVHYQPEFRRTHGPCEKRGIPGRPGRRGSFRRGRQDHLARRYR